MSFQERDTKLEKFLAKNQYYKRKLTFWNIDFSVQTKPLFWFRSNTKTYQNLNWPILSADTVTDTETPIQRENLVNDSMWAPKTKFAAKYYIFQNYFRRFRFIFKLINTYIPQRSGKKLNLLKKCLNSLKKRSFGFGYRYQNWTLVSVPDTETWFWSHTNWFLAKIFLLFYPSLGNSITHITSSMPDQTLPIWCTPKSEGSSPKGDLKSK